MAVILTPENAKPIPDFSPGSFDGDSLILQAKNGDNTRVDGNQVANYAVTQKAYSELGGDTVVQAISKINVKKLTAQTLAVGSTTVTFRDSDILSTSDIFVFTQPAVLYRGVTQSNGEAEITFPAQSQNISVRIWIA